MRGGRVLIWIIVALIVILVAILVISRSGLFKIEKVEIEDQQADFYIDGASEQQQEGEEEIPEFDLDDGVSLKEKMEQNGTLPNTPAEEETERGDESAQERFNDFDRLSEFKTGRGYLVDCQKLLRDAKKKGDIYAAACFDFDRFRFINSLKGQSIGDYVLTRLSQELHTVFPEGSQLTRVSADHFTAVFPVTGMDIFQLIDERMREVCERIRGDIAFKSALRVCIGFCVTDTEQDYDVSILLHKAGVARHCIKLSRDESWKMFEDSMITSYLYGESAVEDYSENQYDAEFTIFFVPQQDIGLKRFLGGEALVRWNCEGSENDAPKGLAKAKLPNNARKVVYQACKTMSRWRKAGKQVLPVSVAVPVTELFTEDFDALLGRCLSEFQLEPGMLAIVFEASMVRIDWSAASRQLKRIRDIGVRVGVDEIDLGYPNLEFLNELTVDFIKLHRSFSMDIQNNEERQGLVRGMLADAERRSARVIFEGVDSQEQADTLKKLGAKEIQGVLSGRPQTADMFAHGLPDYVEKRLGAGTVILDDTALNKGDYTVY